MRRFILSFVVLLASSFCCHAQDASTGSIRGVVLDATGSCLASATISLVSNAAGFHYEQTSDAELLLPGEYTASVSADGMSP